MTAGTAIVGAGHAGFELAHQLRTLGYADPIQLIDSDGREPYQWPPLSKTFLDSTAAKSDIRFRDSDYYKALDIELSLGRRAEWINPDERRLHLSSGDALSYRHLVLATGSEARRLTFGGSQLPGVLYLKDYQDALLIEQYLSRARHVVIIGGGFIGLEVSAAARRRGAETTVVEAQSRLMARAVSPLVANHSHEVHRRSGVSVRPGTVVVAFEGDKDGVRAVRLGSGSRLPADLVIVGVGADPSTALAENAGLKVDNGVLVDEYLLSSDPSISAIGDCCRFPDRDFRTTLRLESVQNATSQATCVAARLTGRAAPYSSVPTFWSHQGDVSLKMAGIA